jgi:hypothetical protein
MSAAEEHGDY